MIKLRLIITGCAVVSTVMTSLGAFPIPTNVRVSGHLPGSQNEEQVWIYPNDSSIVLTNHRDFRLGYRQIGIARSVNGGASWIDTLVAKSFQRFTLQSDPAMTVTSDCNLILAHLDYATAQDPTPDSSRIAVLISDDTGKSWNGPYAIEDSIGQYTEVKPSITSDRTGGQFDGTVYASWARQPNPSHILVARSTDGGMTWDPPTVAGPPSYGGCFPDSGAAGVFSHPLVGRDGAVYVFWQGIVQFPPPGCQLFSVIRMNKSVDGAITWGGARTLVSLFGAGTIEGGVRTWVQPAPGADISSGPHAGNLYLQYMDNTSVAPYHEEIWFQRSLDTGHTWSTPIRVNDDPTGIEIDQFHNWMICNEDGVLVSIWYDQRTDPNHYKFDVFAAYSYDGGATWTSNHRVSSVSIDPSLLAGSIAERIGLACSHDKVVAVWTDTRDGDQDVWSASWELPLTEPRLLTTSAVTLTCGDSLKWSTAWKENEDRYLVEISKTPDFGSGDAVLGGFVSARGLEIPPGMPDDTLYWRIKAYRAPHGLSVDSTGYSDVSWFRNIGCPCACDCHRDPQCDAVANVVDIVNVVDVAFNSVPSATDPSVSCPYVQTDIDCSSVTDVIDVVMMVNVVYRQAVLGTGLCGMCE